MKVLTERNPIWPCLVQKWASLQKTGFYALNSEWKKVPAGSHSSLAHAFLLLAAFWCHLVHFQGKKSILPYFSSLSMVAISVSFPEVRIRKEAEIGLRVQQYTRFDVDDGDEDGDDKGRDDDDGVDEGWRSKKRDKSSVPGKIY